MKIIKLLTLLLAIKLIFNAPAFAINLKNKKSVKNYPEVMIDATKTVMIDNLLKAEGNKPLKESETVKLTLICSKKRKGLSMVMKCKAVEIKRP